MIFKLLKTELKKVFLNKKCIILLAIMLGITGIFIDGSIQTVKYSQMLKGKAAQQELDAFKKTYADKPELYKENTIYYNNKCTTLLEKISAISKYQWKEELQSDIKLKNLEIDKLKEQGITDEDSLKAYTDPIREDSWYLENNVQPVNPKESILGPFFIINYFRNLFPLFVVLILIMTVSDSMAGEFDEGSYKLLFTQPIKRVKILISKLISSIIYNLVFFLSSILPVYLILNNTNTFFTGPGSWIHPVTINKNLFSPFTMPQFIKSTSGEEFKYIFPAAVAAIFLVTFISFLISCLCNSSAQSIIISTAAAMVLYCVGFGLSKTKLSFLSIVSYADPISLIEGSSGSFLNIAIQFIFGAVLSAILIAASIYVVNHKELDK